MDLIVSSKLVHCKFHIIPRNGLVIFMLQVLYIDEHNFKFPICNDRRCSTEFYGSDRVNEIGALPSSMEFHGTTGAIKLRKLPSCK